MFVCVFLQFLSDTNGDGSDNNNTDRNRTEDDGYYFGCSFFARTQYISDDDDV